MCEYNMIDGFDDPFYTGEPIKQRLSYSNAMECAAVEEAADLMTLLSALPFGIAKQLMKFVKNLNKYGIIGE